MCLPLSDDPEAFQTCIFSDNHGNETVEIAWSSAPSHSAPDLTSQNVSNEEVLEVIDSIIEAENHWQESNRFTKTFSNFLRRRLWMDLTEI